MATGSNRDVTMTLSVETLGAEGIKTLQSSVATLAQQGGDAAPEFQRLADEIGRIGEQAQAIAAFKDLATQTDALANKQQEAAAKVAGLADQINQAKQATAAASAEQKDASATLLAAQRAYDAAGSGLKQLNADYKAGTVSAESYRAQISELTAKQGEQRNRFADLRSELKLANAALSEAESAQSKLVTQYDRSDSSLTKANAAIREHNSALSQSSAAAAQLGTSTENVATSEAQLVQGLNQAGNSVNALNERVKALAAVENDLAAQAIFEKQAQDAQKLVQAASYVRFWHEELNKAEVAERELAAQSAFEKQAQDAQKLVQAASYVKFWREELDKADAAERELAAQSAFEKQAQDAQKLVQAASYVQFWREELDKAEVAEKQTAASAQAASQQIANAFRTVGVKSAEDLKNEIVQVRAAMDELRNKANLTGSTLNTAFASGEAKIAALERQLRETNGTLTTGDKAAKLFSNSLGQIAAGNIVADGVGYLVNKVKEMGRAFLDAIVQGDQLKRGLNAIYKDAGIAAQQIDFLRKSSSESGVAFGSLSGEFVKFSAAMKMANVPMAQSNELFRSVTAVTASLGMDAQSTAGALNALGQMASKGCHAPGTRIRMLDGSERVVDHITLGDVIKGPDATGRTVLELAHGTEAMYRITPDVGYPFVVNHSHKMRVFRRAVAETLMVRDFLLLPAREQSLRMLVLNDKPVGFSVSSVGEGEYFGFVLSGDHLYLDAQGFEHHNTVSMEELRQQLGDRLPGALGLAASAMGLSQGQLIALVSSGQLATRDFIVPFTQALNQMKGETDGLVPSWERFKGVLTETAQSAGDSGWTQVLNAGIKVLGGTVGVFALGLSGLSEAFFLVVKGVAALALVFTSPTAAMQLMSDAIEDSRKRLTSQAVALNSLIDPSHEAAAATTAHAAAITANTAEVVKSVNATAGLDAAQKLAALSTKLAADATLDAGAKVVQYNVAAAELLKLQAAQTDGYVKLAKAAKDEGNTLVQNATLTGDNTAIKAAAAQAAQMYAAALDKAAASQATETAMLVAQKAELIKSASAREGGVATVKSQADALDLLITKSKAEAEQSTQAQAAAHAEVQARQLQVETLKDHSTQIDVLKKAMESASSTLQAYLVFASNGQKTEEEVKAAREALTRATVLYNDALGDVVTKLQAKQIADKANATVTEITLNAQKTYYKAMEDSARAVGDYNQVLYASIEQKKIDIKIIEAKVASMKAEADGNIAVAKAELAVLEASGQLDPVRRAQIEASIKIAEAKKKEADALGLTAAALEAEIVRLRNGDSANKAYTSSTNQATTAIERQSTALEASIAAKEKANQLTERANALERERLAIDKEGFSTDKSGNRIAAGGDLTTLTGVAAYLKSAGVADDATARNIAKEFADRQGNITYMDNPGQKKYGGDTISVALLHAAEKYTFGIGNTGTGNTPSTIPEPSKSYTVNLNINGVNTPVNVATDADAKNLIAALQRAKLST
jgi:hypothetical protein